MKSLLNSALGLSLVVGAASTAMAGVLTIVTVNNGHMVEMQKLPLRLKRPTLASL